MGYAFFCWVSFCVITGHYGMVEVEVHCPLRKTNTSNNGQISETHRGQNLLHVTKSSNKGQIA